MRETSFSPHPGATAHLVVEHPGSGERPPTLRTLCGLPVRLVTRPPSDARPCGRCKARRKRQETSA